MYIVEGQMRQMSIPEIKKLLGGPPCARLSDNIDNMRQAHCKPTDAATGGSVPAGSALPDGLAGGTSTAGGGDVGASV